MRLGAQPAALAEGTRAREAYGRERISERHRHRYEFNNTYRQQFTAHGFAFSGTSDGGKLVEIIELPDHPWFVAGQFHPEFRSRPWEPHPLFSAFVKASLDHQGRP